MLYNTTQSYKFCIFVACCVTTIVIHLTVSSIEKNARYYELHFKKRQTLSEGDLEEPILQSADFNETYSQVDGLDMFVRSATYDPRFSNTPFIRMLVMSPPKPPTLYCHVRFARKLVVVKALVKNMPSGPAKKCNWITMILKCVIAISKPLSVSVSASKRKTLNRWYDVTIPQYKPPVTPKYGVCILTLYSLGDGDILNIVEWFELQKLLGVDNVIIYGTHNVSLNVLRVLKMYQDSGFLIYYSWTIPVGTFAFADKNGLKLLPSSKGCVNHFAREHIYHECFYGHMDRFTYIAIQDIDEFIIPAGHFSWKDMLKDIEAEKTYNNFTCFTVLGACFETAANESNIVKGQNMNVYMATKSQQIVNQFGRMMKIRPYIKSIVKPQFVDIPSTHFIKSVVPPHKGCVEIPPTIVKLHHYRKNGCRFPPENVSFDDTMSRYYEDLLPRMEKTLAKLLT